MQPGRNQAFQLFDPVADPGERRDLAAREPAAAARLARAYQEWLHDVKRDASEPPPPVPRAPRKKG
jgi:hypothetical protein